MSSEASSPTPLERDLTDMIAAEGPLPIDRYMAMCLGHPQHGYYRHGDPLGRAGDFITAPEVSQVFGELIGVWCAVVWQAMAMPSPVRLVELGPGRGTLMADVLRAARVVPGFVEASELHLVETSPALRRKQKAALSAAARPARWHSEIDTVPPGPTILVANEFFDALPVRQLVRTGARWHERLVGIDDAGRLSFGLSPDPVPERLVPNWARHCAHGDVVEISPARHQTARRIGTLLKDEGGAAIIIDYGHVRSAPGDTLQAVRHHAHAGVLEQPGKCDITSHVDFEGLARALGEGGAAVYGPLTQAMFLNAMGLAERAEMLKRGADPHTRMSIDTATTRLAGESEMGHLFKVIAATHPDLPPPYPFGESSP